MNLNIRIEHLKGISKLDLNIPIKKGLHAITGENGSGKSTIMAVLSKVFQPQVLEKYFHTIRNPKTKIIFEYDGKKETWIKDDNWKKIDNTGDIILKGFFEGSVIHGTRFSDTNYGALLTAERVNNSDLVSADEFVIKNLSWILHGEYSYYKELKRIKVREIAFKKFHFKGTPYFMVYDQKLVSQFALSTGESLLISLLHFINTSIIRYIQTGNLEISFILIDEVELALHPSALKRLVDLLDKLTEEYNLCIYFSTHSIELIRNINPDNIFYVQRNRAKEIEIVTPCYPAYATRSLYCHDGYDFLILVEDDLAKYIVKRIIEDNNLYERKLYHILPCGGWENIIRMHKEIVLSNLIGYGKTVISILDGDIKAEYEKKYKGSTLKLNFLPIHSIEKYLIKKLIQEEDTEFIRKFGDKFFRIRAIEDIIKDYISKTTQDTDGKILFMVLKKCAEDQGMTSIQFIEAICEFIYKKEDFSKLKLFLEKML